MNTDTTTEGGSELNTADVAGIVSGCVVFVGLLTAGSAFIYKSYKNSAGQVEKEHEHEINESDQSEEKIGESINVPKTLIEPPISIV